MDNAAFRSLVSKPTQDGKSTTTFKKPVALGSRARSSIPMTPRNVPSYNGNREFARQVAEQTSTTGEPPLKKFKASAAPKGTKLGAGYVDRTQLRKGEDEEDDRATRLNNLEVQLKLGQIEQAQFEALREQIGVGGDVGSTHLVKGLDWKLLQRVRRGEDITQSEQETRSSEDVDEELERALEKDVTAMKKDKQVTGADEIQTEQTIMTRDEILRNFRQQRNGQATTTTAAPSAPVLNDRFKKVGNNEKPGKRKFIESINGRRREVLVVTKKDGTTKRKTRWIDPEDVSRPEQQPLGMEVPAEIAAKHKAMLEAQAAEDDNEDIFAEAGGDYDPLADINSDSEESDEARNEPSKTEATTGSKKRNYFSAENESDDSSVQAQNPMASDPTILAALKRAAQIRLHEGGTDASGQAGETVAGAKSSAFLAKLKESERQDAADLDYGFGDSRFGDDDDEDAGPLYDDEEGEKKKSGRKRGAKKRKGNKDNLQDVMNVLEGRNKKS